jgi:hypothetical protein
MTITSEKIAEYVKAGINAHEIARWLINTEINKHCPLSLDDLPDTATVGSEIDAIVDCLDEGDYQDAINMSIDGAQLILEDEGFDLNNNSEEDS